MYKNTLIGFFDILSYSELIRQNSFEDIQKKIENLFSETASISKTDMGNVNLEHWILSDSVLVVVNTLRSKLFLGSIDLFLVTCSVIMAEAMKYKLPLRGAIGGGYFYKKEDVIISSALVDAASFEKKQEWLGAVITPSATQLIEEAIKTEEHFGQHHISDKFSSVKFGRIPWKENHAEDEGVLQETYYLQPFDFNEPDWDKKYLPDHFKSPQKIANSKCLYGEDS